jgi:ribonucleoside-diphosphate reductase alpha chain
VSTTDCTVQSMHAGAVRPRMPQIKERDGRIVEGGDDGKLSLNAVEVLRRRYLLKDERGNVVETPHHMFARVAKAVASAELSYSESKDRVKEIERGYYSLMRNLEFLPNSPTLMNAGTELGQLAACFVLPIEDSMDSIFNAVKNAALIHQSGGGTGFSFSRLRPEGDVVKSTGGIASGPVSFMRVFDVATDVIKQGGKRRGANMGILRVDHPDIVAFIKAKNQGGFANFNISAAVTDAFMQAVEKNEEYALINPRTKEAVKRLNARAVFDELVTCAWKTGDPGIIFIDEINRHNPLSAVGRIEATNPCGEQPLLPYESCNLGSINVSKFVNTRREIDWERLREAVWLCTRFLDDVIDVNRYPLRVVEQMTKASRKIGLGIMGFAELLISLGIAYDSRDACATGEKLMQFITDEARQCSKELGREKGSFPHFELSVWTPYETMRNATVTTIAPTGTIGIIAGCSSGIEPLFAVAFLRNVMDGMLELNKLFEAIAKERGFYSTDLITAITRSGSVQDIAGIPADVKRVFVTALDIAPEWHVRMQAAFQKYTDNATSKTVNLPGDATRADVERVFLLAYKLRCKGITVYRYGCKDGILSLNVPKLMIREYVCADSEYAGECRICSV